MTNTEELDGLIRKNQNYLELLAAQGIRLEASINLLSAISKLTAVPVRTAGLTEASVDVLDILVSNLTDINNCSLLLFEPCEGLLKLLAARGLSDNWGEGEAAFNKDLAFEPGQGIAGRVFSENRPLFWNHDAPEAEILDLEDGLPTPESLACLPLATWDRRIGVLNVSFGTPRPFDHIRRRELLLLSGVVANVIQAFILKLEREKEIAEREEAERKLRWSLEEKEVLLREIHHRVKNNLQVISSLFYLQADYVDDPRSLEILRESRNRVKSMALVHERLYRSADLAKIDFVEYIRSLANELFVSYGINQNIIGLKIESDQVLLGVDRAIPLGLIVNELVSNSLKHAFSDGREGELRLEIQVKDDRLNLVVSDNGRGFPENLDWQGVQTLGLRIVKILIDQLGGEIELDKSAGTRFTIRLTSRDSE